MAGLRGDVGDRHRPVRRGVAEHRRPHPALQLEPAAVLQRIGGEGGDRAVEGQLHGRHRPVRLRRDDAAEAGVEGLDVDAVPGAGEPLQHEALSGTTTVALGEVGIGAAELEHLVARRVLVGQQVDVVAEQRRAGDVVFEARSACARPACRRPTSASGETCASSSFSTPRLTTPSALSRPGLGERPPARRCPA